MSWPSLARVQKILITFSAEGEGQSELGAPEEDWAFLTLEPPGCLQAREKEA